MFLVILLCDLSIIMHCLEWWCKKPLKTWSRPRVETYFQPVLAFKILVFTVVAWKDSTFSFPGPKPFWVPLQLSTHWLCGKPAQLILQQKEHPYIYSKTINGFPAHGGSGNGNPCFFLQPTKTTFLETRLGMISQFKSMECESKAHCWSSHPWPDWLWSLPEVRVQLEISFIKRHGG